MMLKIVTSLAPPYLTIPFLMTPKIITVSDLPILTVDCLNVEPIITRIASHLEALKSGMLSLAISKRKQL